MPVKKTSKRGKKRVKTRRVRAGARPSAAVEQQHSQQLQDLARYAYERHINRQPLANNRIEEVYALSPYAQYRDGRYLLETFVSRILSGDTNEALLINVIERTVAENDPDIFNERIVDAVIESLLRYGNRFNESINILLHSVPPISNIQILSGLYENIIRTLNISALQAMRDAGHVPLTYAHLADIIADFNESLNFYNGTGYQQNRTPGMTQRFAQFGQILRTLRPMAETNATNILYNLGQQQMHLQPDNMDDLMSHLNASAEDMYTQQVNRLNELMNAAEEAEEEEADY
jgi:hypothetical protein